jgi:hypothetical protein
VQHELLGWLREYPVQLVDELLLGDELRGEEGELPCDLLLR